MTVLHSGTGDSCRYRCEHLAEQLAGCGWAVTLQDLSRRDRAPFAPCDLCVVHRVALDGFVGAGIARLRREGALVLFDADDLIFEPDAALKFASQIGSSRLHRAVWRLDLEGIRQTFESADGVLAATGFLASRARLHGKPSWVHRNAFGNEMRARSAEAVRLRQRGGRVVIGYASGTPTHARDFAVARPALQCLLRRHGNTELRIVGHLDAGVGWGEAGERVVHVPFVPWRDLPAELARFDINLAPLEVERAFCQAKSEVKYIEAGLVGVPTVASPTDAFLEAIRDGENGFLASTDDEWVEKLDALVTDASLRERVGRNASLDAHARYCPEVRAKELVGTLQAFSHHQRAVAQIAPAVTVGPAHAGSAITDDYRPFPASLLSKGWYSLRFEGVWAFVLRGLASLSGHARRARG